MSIHLDHKDYDCQACGMKFVPFKKDMECPACGVKVSEFYDFIDGVLKAFKYHKSKSGRYFPDSWHVGSQADRFQAMLFQFFDSLEFEKQEPADKKQYIMDMVNDLEWTDEAKFLKKNFNEIASEFFDRYMAVRDDLLATGISHQEFLRQEEELVEQWRLKNEKRVGGGGC